MTADLSLDEPRLLFDPLAARDLPEPARRWLRHTLAPGAPLTTSVEMDLAGRIKLGRWRPFEATQQLNALEGYVWAEHTSVLGAPVRGRDELVAGRGALHHAAFGHLPLVALDGPDVTRSAYARLACELVYTPAAALDSRVTWDQLGWHLAVARVDIGPEPVDVVLDVDPHGRLARLWCRRWAKLGHQPWQHVRFQVEVLSEGRTGGTCYPRRVLAGYASEEQRWPTGAFIEQSVLDYRPSTQPCGLAPAGRSW